MNHEEIVTRVNKRIDKLEAKIDKYLELTTKQETDLQWVKGYIRVSISFIVAISVGLVTSLFKLFNH